MALSQHARMNTVDHQIQHPGWGMALISISMLMIPGLDAFAKLLGQQCGWLEITFWRFFMQTLLMLPFVIISRAWTVPKGTLALQMVRGLLLATATAFFFAALKSLPMAEAISIFFMQPLILTLLSALLLGEQLRFRRLGAILVGFMGTLIILQPSFLVFGWAATLPMASALMMALYMIVTRHLSAHVGAVQMQFLGSVTSMVVLAALLAIVGWSELDGGGMTALSMTQISWVIGMGIIATSAHMLMVLSTKYAPANLLAPFQYLEIIGASTLGFLVFGDVPADSTFAGVAIIIASGLYLFHRERVNSGPSDIAHKEAPIRDRK